MSGSFSLTCLMVLASLTMGFCTRSQGAQARTAKEPMTKSTQSGVQYEELGSGSSKKITRYYCYVEPIPGLKAEVTLKGPITELDKLTDDELRQRYQKFVDLLNKSAIPGLRYNVSDSRVEDWKKEIVATFVALQDHHTATSDEADRTFRIALDNPSVANVVLAHFSYIRSMLYGNAERLRGQVADRENGVAIGFMTANATDKVFEVGGGEVTPIKWSFRKATSEALPDSTRIYQIAVQVSPSNVGQFTTPFAQSVVDGGHLENKDWTYELKLPAGFQEQKISVSAVLKSYSDKASLDAGKASTTDSIDLPFSEVSLKEKPSHLWTLVKEALKNLKQFFGILGGIPTVIVAWQGVHFFRKKKQNRRSNKKHLPAGTVE